jgi:hypothetical protein
LGQGWRLSLGQILGRAIAGGLGRLHQGNADLFPPAPTLNMTML